MNTAFTFHRSLGSTYWGKGAYQVRQHNEIISDATPSPGEMESNPSSQKVETQGYKIAEGRQFKLAC